MNGFRPGRDVTLLSLLAVAIFLGLGYWQLSKHWRKSAELAEQSARAVRPPISLAEAASDLATAPFRRVDARGRFELADTILIGPVEHGRELGARVITPLRIEGTSDDAPRLLVARGFVPQHAMSRFLPPESGESEPVEVRGVALILALPRPEEMPLPGSRAARRTHFPRFTPDRPRVVAEIAEQLPYRLEPLLLQAIESEPGGLPIAEPPTPVSLVDHRGYAIQWTAIALLSLCAWFEYGRRRARELAESAAGSASEPVQGTP
jgi:cytochrome oxidase assembly protein ShyY1